MGGAFLWKIWMESGFSISGGRLRAVYRSALQLKPVDGTAGCIAKEIFSFVSAAVPEQCAREWMIQSGAMEPSEFLQAVADMEDVRLKARLLALELAAMNVRYNVLDTIPWDRLN